MPLRDHFHPPISRRHSWEGFHGLWPGIIVLHLVRELPKRYLAEPRVHLGSQIEIDVATLEGEDDLAINEPESNSLAFEPSQPSLALETDLASYNEYEVRIYDTKHNRRLVAAIELVSPSNKDRPESRHDFVTKCASLLRKGVCVALVDLVTDMHFNLYSQLLESIHHIDPAFEPEPASIYAVSCRWIPRGTKHVLEAWSHPLRLGEPLPTLPIWLAENFAVPLNLEATYEETCRALRIS
ncbi:MAG: DUF4058 family protein [Kiritimatiellae bacterium]|jgi:hypothetical protein|nr:DUF4058 family protein [Kiritimatiellia bacterium]